MKRKILTICITCVCCTILFHPLKTFAIDWEQWRITHDQGDEDKAQRLQQAAEARAEQAQERAKERAEREKQAYEQRQAEGNRLGAEGDEAYKRCDWKTAIDCYKKALKANPDYALMRINLKYAQEWLVIAKKQAAAAAKEKAMIEAEQRQLEKNPAAWTKKEKKLIQERLEKPNKWCDVYHRSLMSEVPPLASPYPKYDELQPGDVLLIAASGVGGHVVNTIDRDFDLSERSEASHTVMYLKTVNGKKLFLDNQPFKGPHIISEDKFLEDYGARGGQVARFVGQPLNEKEAQDLFKAAIAMAQKNNKAVAKNWFGATWYDTNYGAWGKDNVVCSEADWQLLKSAGRQVPKSGNRLKTALGIDFSPADFQDQQYFLVTSLDMPK